MEEKTIENRVVEIVTRVLGLDLSQVTLEADLVVDLGADQLDLVELTLELEEEFAVEVPDDEFGKLRTVSDLVKYVEAAVKLE